MADVHEHPGDAPPSRAARARAWGAARRADAQRLEERAQHERTQKPIPTFAQNALVFRFSKLASFGGTLVCGLRNRKDTGNVLL